MVVLLGPNTPQSDHDPEAAAAASDGSFARHPLTGAFTEPLVESAWSASSFRDAYPLHAILLAAVLMIQLVGHAVAFAWYGWSAVWRLHVPLYLALALVALVGRNRLHRMQEDLTLTLTLTLTRTRTRTRNTQPDPSPDRKSHATAHPKPTVVPSRRTGCAASG